MGNKLKFFLILFLIPSCANLGTTFDYQCSNKYFNIIISSNLSKTMVKKMSNKIMNETNIKYDSTNEKNLIITVNTSESNSLLTDQNISGTKNIFLTINYRIVVDENIVENKNFKIVEDLSVNQSKRYTTDINRNYVYENLFNQMKEEIDSRIELFLGKCDKSYKNKI